MTRRKGPSHLMNVDGVWYYRRPVPKALKAKYTTREIREKIGANLRRAEKYRDERDKEIENEARNPDGFTLFRDFVTEKWLKVYVKGRRNPKGQELARVRMEMHVFPVLGGLPLCEIKRDHLRSFKLALVDPERESPLSAQTAKHVMCDVRCALRYAANDCEIITRAPSFAGLMPVVDEAVPQPIAPADLVKLLAAGTEEDRFVLDIARWTGMRMEEITRIHRSHIFLDGRRPRIVVPISKNHQPREIPLMPMAVERLRSWMREHRTELMLCPLTYDQMSDMFRRLCRKTGVTAHFHMLRHTFACTWLAAGGSILELQKILGHSTLELTQRYASLMAVHISAAAALVGPLFEKHALEHAHEDEMDAESTRKGSA